MQRLVLISLTVLASLTVAGCTQAGAPPTTPTAALSTPATSPPSPGAPEAAPTPRGTIVFDMGHGEIFGADNTTELGQSQAIARMREAGFEVTVNPDTITADDLADASGLIIAGPMRPLLDEEYDAVNEFVTRGGTVLLTIHVPFPVLKVPAHWGLPVGTDILMSESPLSPTDQSVFTADQIEPSPVTEGVNEVTIVSGWPVEAVSKKSDIVVNTREDTWLTPARGAAPSNPGKRSYGVLGVARIGDGHVIVSGDDAVFANIALGTGDNARLLDNIIRMMSEMADV